MTVEELIEKLSKLPKNAICLIPFDDDGITTKLVKITYVKKNNTVIFDSVYSDS